MFVASNKCLNDEKLLRLTQSFSCFFRYHASVAHPALKIAEELKLQELFCQLCLPCYCHATPSSLCDDVQLYLQLTCCTLLLVSYNVLPPSPISPCDSFTNPDNALLKMKFWYQILRNGIGIISPVKLYFNLERELTFTLQALRS